MKAIRVHAPGGPEVLHYEDTGDPIAGRGEVLIALETAGINFSDTGSRRSADHAFPYSPRQRGRRHGHRRRRGCV
jgi:NADPH:quinone reductase-like Zn-dependent oxidoreductase